VEDGTNGIGVLTTVEQEDGVQALGDTVIIGLFEATPQILAPITAQGK
jgi:hypothetical protein